MSSLLLVAPLVVFALVLVLGFVGCQLPTQGTATDNYGFEVSNSGPVAWWRLSDPAGSAKAKDEIGDPPLGAHWGNYQGNVLPGQYPGLVWGGGPSASFDGGSVDVGHDDVFQSPSFTVEAFVRLLPDTLAVTRSIVENRSSTGGWALGTGPPDEHGPEGYLEGFLSDGDVSITAKVDFKNLAMPPVVLHVAMTFDGQPNAVNLYVNGVGLPDQSSGLPYAPNTLVPLQIGVGFLGAIQEVAVYDRVLTPQEIAKHFQASQGG